MKPGRLQWTPELVNRFWDAFAQTRLVAFSFSKQGGRSLIIAVDHLLPRDGKILDFGAGNGHLIQLMSERGLKAAAYEPSENRMEYLRNTLSDCAGFLGVISDNDWDLFDAVIAAEVLEHILDELLDKTLGRLSNLTKPGGIVIITTPNNEDLELGMAYCPVSNLLFHRWQHVRSFTRETLCTLMDRFGFDEIATHQLSF
jgi:2-polyprenyl-3-methyl-5-hydroxy-6-metoxy-1,4-benzoquinol methylase